MSVAASRSAGATDVAILGTGMTDMGRRDLAPETMAYEVVRQALDDAGVAAEELGLVIVGNAMAGRLSDQGCVRGQSWLRKVGLTEAAILNVDNSCAGGSSALHLATMAATVQDRPVLALGVEKMWTGNRAETIAGIEDGLPTEYRRDLHERRHEDDNPAGSILMGLNNTWAQRLMRESGATLRQIAAAAAKAFEHAARNPLAQFHRRVTVDEVLASPQVAGVLTPPDVQLVHRRCGRRRPGRPDGPGPGVGAPYHRVGGPLRQRHPRLPRPADPGGRRRLGGLRVRAGRGRHGRAARRHCGRGALRPRVAGLLRPRAKPGRPPRQAPPASTRRAWWSTRAVDWWAGGIRSAPPGWPRWSS